MELQKETKQHGKWYQDACGAAFAFELLGERWSLLIVRELLIGPRRFSELRASLPGISAKVLTERLTSLQCSGLVLHRKLPPPASVQVYELTEWGQAAEPAMLELCRWAVRSPAHDPTLYLSPTALLLSLKAMFDPAAAQGVSMAIGFDVGGSEFVIGVEGGRLDIRRGEVEQADVIFRADVPLPLLQVFFGKAPPELIEAAGDLQIEGARERAAEAAGLFTFPAKIAPPPGG